MTNRLFVGGTLAPSQSNAHVLPDLVGTWEMVFVNGTVQRVTWGPASGYPGILLNDDDGEASGLIFSSDELTAHWEKLDALEGDGYTRKLVVVLKLVAGFAAGFVALAFALVAGEGAAFAVDFFAVAMMLISFFYRTRAGVARAAYCRKFVG